MIKLARTLVLPLVLVVSVAACDKGKKAGGGGSTGEAGASSIAPAQGGLKRALAAMPADTEFIIGMDVTQLRKSDLWKKYEPMAMAKAGPKLAEFKTKCGFDPIEKLQGVLVGGKGQQFDDATVFVRGFEKKAVLDCLGKLANEPKAEGGTATRTLTVDGDYVEMGETGEDPMRFLFIDNETILILKRGEAAADKPTLLAAAGAKDGDGLTSSKTFVSLLDSTKTASSLWFLMNASAPMLAQATSQLPGNMKFLAIFGSVNVSAGVDGEMRFRMANPDGAQSLKAMAELGIGQAAQAPMAADMVKGVKLSVVDSDTVMTFKYDEAQIQKMVTLAQGMGGGL